MNWCSDCKQPCNVIRVNYGPCSRDDVERRRDSYSDGSDCCEAETTEYCPLADDDPRHPDYVADEATTP